jgi:predicted PolB exonuclease-like 3'-5' exonuclease
VKYLILDVESVVDDALLYDTSRLVSHWTGGGQASEPHLEDYETCCTRVQDKICTEEAKSKNGGDCFIPHRFQRPILVSMLLVDSRLCYVGHRTHYSKGTRVVIDTWNSIREAFDMGVTHIVTFNGKRFDLPLLENWALRLHHPIPFWFPAPGAKVWENPRTFSEANPRHLDVLQLMAGAAQIGGDLHYWSRLVGLPGKIDTSGSSVAKLFAEEKWDQIEDYCLCDCLNTLGVFMAYMEAAGLGPGPRSPAFEASLNAVVDARKAAGTSSPELIRFWKLYGTEVPF